RPHHRRRARALSPHAGPHPWQPVLSREPGQPGRGRHSVCRGLRASRSSRGGSQGDVRESDPETDAPSRRGGALSWPQLRPDSERHFGCPETNQPLLAGQEPAGVAAHPRDLSRRWLPKTGPRSAPVVAIEAMFRLVRWVFMAAIIVLLAGFVVG